jgi:peptidoglycan/xylan/chitin deacetylase (PgdA/CDA1 family)
MTPQLAGQLCSVAAGTVLLLVACGDETLPQPLTVAADPPRVAATTPTALAHARAALHEAQTLTPAPEATPLPATPTDVPSAPAAATSPAAPAAVAPTTAPPAPAPQRADPPVASPRVTGLGAARVIDRGRTDRRFIALSFDAGADVGYTTAILDTLRDRGVRASFGMTGRWAEQNPDLLRRIVAEGHHLINHTYSHDSFTGLSTGRGPMSAGARAEQLARTEAAVRSIAATEFGPYFRPPFGDYDASVNADVGARGYAYNVMWTVDSLGWNGLSASGIVQRCLQRSTPGAIYIFHVGAQSQDGPALPAVIDGLLSQGYTLGTVAELVEG